MKIVKIGAIWCGACLLMNKVWSKLKENTSIEFLEYDYDIDEEEVMKYNPGKILPVFIFFQDDKELFRMIGEFSYEDVISKLNEVGVEL